MNLPGFSVQRPVFVTMATLIVIILGGMALVRLPIDLLPEIELPTLTVSTTYENASPEEMERLVTQVVEEAVAAVPGVEEIVSSSAEGLSNVQVRFVWGMDLDVAANDVRDRLDRVTNRLPPDAERPQLRKFDPARFPILLLGVASPLDPIELTMVLDQQVQHRIERIPGVAAVDVWGGYEREIQVNIDADRLRALDLPLAHVLQTIRAANVNVPAGEIERGWEEITLRIPGEVPDLETLGNITLMMRDGAPVRLNQVATIRDTHRDIQRIIRIDGQLGVRIAVRKQAEANTVTVARAVLAEVEQLNHDLPQLSIVPVMNNADFIERSIDNVSRSILYGGSLAILVLLLFLRNMRSTVVIAVAIPVSVIATFALVYFAGFTLNLMTLGGLALGVGMMVDNAIVVLENIFRHRDELKQGRRDSATRGAGEVAAAIVASTITTLVIFLPLIFVEGTAGVLFRQLGLVVAFALACSLLVALSMVPMLASKVMLSREQMEAKRPGWLQRQLVDRITAALNAMDRIYGSVVRKVLHWPITTLMAAIVLVAATATLLPTIGTEFMPPTDEGEVRVSAEMAVGTRLGVIDRQMWRVEEIVEEAVPERFAMVTSVGPSTWRPSAAATGDIRLSLVPQRERQRSNEQVADDLRQRLEGRIPGMTIRVRAPQGMMLLNRLIGGDEGLAVEIRGFDLQTLDRLTVEVRDAVEDIPGVTDVRVSREAGVPQLLLRIDRDRAADLGLNVQQIANTLETAIAGSRAGDYREHGYEYRILVRLEDALQQTLDDILDLTITNDRGEAVLLRNVVDIEEARGPVLIDRKDQQRLASVNINISGRDLGSVARDIQDRLNDVPRPAGYDFTIAGSYEEQQQAFRELMVSLALSLVLVYMVMACLYESLRNPLVVMFSVPVASVGVILMLSLTNTTFNVQSFIGCIMLGGIVVNNAILIVDQADRLRRHDKFNVRDAVAEAGRRRLRPILMTTLTTMLGLAPLALGIGEGAEAQAPLARAVIGGLGASTLITLLLIPAVYRLFHPEKKAAS